MPKARMTEREKQEKALYRAVARSRVDLDLLHDQDVAEKLGMAPSTYAKRKRDLYSGFGFGEASRLVKGLQVTDVELCEIFGVRYNPNRDSAEEKEE